MTTQNSRLDEAQGASEQQTEPYMQYGEGAAQLATPRFAKSGGVAADLVSKHVGVAGDLR